MKEENIKELIKRIISSAIKDLLLPNPLGFMLNIVRHIEIIKEKEEIGIDIKNKIIRKEIKKLSKIERYEYEKIIGIGSF